MVVGLARKHGSMDKRLRRHSDIDRGINHNAMWELPARILQRRH